MNSDYQSAIEAFEKALSLSQKETIFWEVYARNLAKTEIFLKNDPSEPNTTAASIGENIESQVVRAGKDGYECLFL